MLCYGMVQQVSGGVEDMVDIEDIVRSLEFPIGTRFYFKNTLLEVAELEDDGWGCSQCAFAGEEDICGVMNCGRRHRHDSKCTYFNEVNETEEEKQ